MSRGRFLRRPSALAGIEAVEASSRHGFPRHTHDRFGIGLVLAGAQRSASGRGMVEAGAGDVITVNPGEVHDGVPLGDRARHWTMLYLDPAVVARAAGDIAEGGGGAAEFADPVVADRRLAARFAALFGSLTGAHGGQAGEERLLGLLSGLLALRPPAHAGVPAAISRVRERIDADPAAPHTLSDLAAEVGLGRYRLLRGFSRATGLTPHAYVLQRRLQRARRLIGAGMGLAEAAQAAGFSDQSHMTRLFSRTYGLTPGAYAAGG